MELGQFLRSKVTEFIDYKVSLKQNSNYNIRSEEVGIFNSNIDYESKIKNYMSNGKVNDAKKLYKELLDKFNPNLNKGVTAKLITLLEKITNIIKNQLQGYGQELILKPELDRFNKIIQQRRLIPDEIMKKDSNIKFVEKNSAVQPQESIARKKELPRVDPISIIKNNIKKAIRNQDINTAVKSYKTLRELFYSLPDEAKDVKSELFSDLLSINLRIHVLAKEIIKMKTNLIEKENYRKTIEKLVKIKQEKKLLEQKLNDEKVPLSPRDMPEEYNKYQTITQESYSEETPLGPDVVEGENEVQKLKRLAKLKRIQHDKNLHQNFPKIERKSKEDLSIKNELTDKDIEQIKIKPKVKRVNKDVLVKDLYAKGIKTIFEKDREKAKIYFQRILGINPNYKPALIRLEQLT